MDLRLLADVAPSGAVAAWAGPAVTAAVVTGTMFLTNERLKARESRRDRRAGDLRADVREAQDALLALRAAYRRRAHGAADAPDDFTLAELEDAFCGATRRTLSAEAMVRGDHYVRVGRMYARQDEDTGVREEDAAYAAATASVLDALTVSR